MPDIKLPATLQEEWFFYVFLHYFLCFLALLTNVLKFIRAVNSDTSRIVARLHNPNIVLPIQRLILRQFLLQFLVHVISHDLKIPSSDFKSFTGRCLLPSCRRSISFFFKPLCPCLRISLCEFNQTIDFFITEKSLHFRFIISSIQSSLEQSFRIFECKNKEIYFNVQDFELPCCRLMRMLMLICGEWCFKAGPLELLLENLVSSKEIFPDIPCLQFFNLGFILLGEDLRVPSNNTQNSCCLEILAKTVQILLIAQVVASRKEWFRLKLVQLMVGHVLAKPTLGCEFSVIRKMIIQLQVPQLVMLGLCIWNIEFDIKMSCCFRFNPSHSLDSSLKVRFLARYARNNGVCMIVLNSPQIVLDECSFTCKNLLLSWDRHLMLLSWWIMLMRTCKIWLLLLLGCLHQRCFRILFDVLFVRSCKQRNCINLIILFHNSSTPKLRNRSRNFCDRTTKWHNRLRTSLLL